MSAISDNLIHFLARAHKDAPHRQLEVFRSIIEHGLRTAPVQIKYPEGESVFNQVICFTDIPLRECSEHTAVYGKFGIGFKKSYVKNAGGNPARYFLDYMPGRLNTEQGMESRGALFLHQVMQVRFMMKLYALLGADEKLELHDGSGATVLGSDELKQLADAMLYCFSFDKEMGDLGRARDESREIDLYYKEREWRLVPSRLDLVSGAIRHEEGSAHVFYPFRRVDVNMVVVPNEELRLSVLDFFLSLRGRAEQRLQEFGADPPPVISYDEMHRW